jgi:hypothetical protein
VLEQGKHVGVAPTENAETELAQPTDNSNAIAMILIVFCMDFSPQGLQWFGFWGDALRILEFPFWDRLETIASIFRK